MKAVTYTNARKNLKALIHAVCKDSEPAIIVSNEAEEEQVVLISPADYQSMEETSCLYSSPANRAHLERSLRQAQSGKPVTFPVEDL